jgi:16S rRNA (cytosine967-C5)-methyltransferase
MPGFSEGLFFVQDEASAIAAIALGAEPGDTCIDVCSAPGGKSFLLSILCADNRINEGTKVYSFDIHESKLSLIVSGKERLSLTSLIAKVMDAREPESELFGKADKVLCDVPCSGLGVMRKKADIRYKDLDAARELLPLQREILNASSKYLGAGGELVYSTCTLNEEENIGICSSFLSDNPDFSPVDFEIGELKSCSGALTLYPHIHNTDGFFIFKMKKNS